MSMSPVMPSELGHEESVSKHAQCLEDENRLLFDQLQVVQEELGRLYDNPQRIGGGLAPTVIQVAPVDVRLVEAQAEQIRLEYVLKVQTQLYDIKTQYALASQLGEILIQGVQSTTSLLAVPGRLRQAWRQNRRTQPSAELGGKSFDKVIQAYQQGGDQRVESLFAHVSVAKNVQASAWTAVARTFMDTEPTLVASLARRAFALEPRGFRQKWLTFRLHESGDLLEAEALLALLPEDVSWTESEVRQRDRLLKQAYEFRVDQVHVVFGIQEQHAKFQRQWDELAQSRDAAITSLGRQREDFFGVQCEAQRLAQEKEELLAVVGRLQAQVQQLQTDVEASNQARDQQRQFVLQEQVNTKILLKQVEGLKCEFEQESLLRAQSQGQCLGLQADLKRLGQVLNEKEMQAGRWFEQCVTVQGGLAEMVQQCEELKIALKIHLEGKEAVLLQLQALTQIHDELLLLAEQRREEGGGLSDQLKASVVEREELWGQLQGEQAQVESLMSQVKELIAARDEQAALIAQHFSEGRALQSQLSQALQTRDEYAVLAAQRQGELLHQAKEQLKLERSKAALEARQLELQQLLSAQAGREIDMLERLGEQVQVLAAREVAAPSMVEELFKKQADDFLKVRRHLEIALKKNSVNAVRQLQSFVGMQEYFATGVLPAFNSEAHSWPVSADFALCLMQQLVLKPYDLVIEFGSGMSTVIVAKTLALIAERNGSRQTQFVSFEHLDSYYEQTLAYVRQAGLEKAVQLTLAPLEDWQSADGQIYPYYSCQNTLMKLAKQRQAPRKRILVIVDGPPASTGPQARYPAGPLLMAHFPNAHIDFLMDDYIREDEKQVAQHWMADMEAMGLAGSSIEYKLEKDACLLTVHSKDSK